MPYTCAHESLYLSFLPVTTVIIWLSSCILGMTKFTCSMDSSVLRAVSSSFGLSPLEDEELSPMPIYPPLPLYIVTDVRSPQEASILSIA